MFDWERILINNAPVDFLAEVALRSAIMFIILLIVLKLAGKRGVKQLSIFEMVIIISLGSAAGDPMFYEDVGILQAIVVFIVVLALYRISTWLTGKSSLIEKLLEGETECLVDNGRFSVEKFKRGGLAQDEFFAELRLRNVEHLGQVKKAYLETSGNISVFFYENADCKPGMPILPELFKQQLQVITNDGHYCCCKCGSVHELSSGATTCPTCEGTKWVKPIHTKRIA
jgi:uncharacterized membrane protein YcaP (DUF421 family)